MRELMYIDKNCPHCGAHFNAGRRNKKFCSSKCRSGFHNEKYRKVNLEQGQTNKQLLTNYRIIRELLEEGRFDPMNIPVAVMSRKGFNPKLFTGSEELNEDVRGTLRKVYDLGWTRNLVAGTFQLYRLTKDGKIIPPRKP